MDFALRDIAATSLSCRDIRKPTNHAVAVINYGYRIKKERFVFRSGSSCEWGGVDGLLMVILDQIKICR